MAIPGYLPQQKIVYYDGKAYIDNRPDFSSLGMTATHPSLLNAVTQQNLPQLISQKQLVPFMGAAGSAAPAAAPPKLPPMPMNTVPKPGWTPPGAPGAGGGMPGAGGGMSMDQILNGQTFGKAPTAMTTPLPRINNFQDAIAKALPNAGPATMQSILGG